jgi:hypothetical protein
MSRARYPKIPQRRRVFLGCEGESERGYGGVLRWFLDSAGAHVHLELKKLGGGDPLAQFEKARKFIEWDWKLGNYYEIHAVLLDTDKLGAASGRDAQIQELIRATRIIPIWQRPCHEAFLLRHLLGCEQRQPLGSADAIAQLRREWPDYEKGLSAMELAERIGEQQIRQAMAVEPELADFLRSLGVR